MSYCIHCGTLLGTEDRCPACHQPVVPSTSGGTVADGSRALPPEQSWSEDTVIRPYVPPAEVNGPPARLASGPAPAAPPPPTPPPPKGRRTALLVTAIVISMVVVMAGIGTAVAMVLNNRSAAPKADHGSTPTHSAGTQTTPKQEPVRTLPTSFLGEPSSQWEVSPSDFLDGADGIFYDARPYGYSEMDGAEALYTPDAVVVGVVGTDDGAQPRILGLDPSSGHLLWQFDDTAKDTSTTCFSLPSKHAVACLGDHQLTEVDTAKDNVERPVPSTADAILDGPGDSIYSVSYAYSKSANVDGDNPALASVTVQRGTPIEPSRDWEQKYPITQGKSYDGNLTSAESGDQLSLGLEELHLLIDNTTGELKGQKTSDPYSDADPFDLKNPTRQYVAQPDEVLSGNASVKTDDDPTEVSVYNMSDKTLAWSRKLPDADDLADPYGEGFGRSSAGFAGSSVVFSSLILMEGWTGFGSGTASNPDGAGVQYRTPCGKEPKVVPESTTTSEGAVRVVLKFIATCPGGQWVDGKAVDLALTTQSGGETIGHAIYDFSQTPVWLPDPSGDDSEVQVTVDLPPGSLFALPDEVRNRVTTIIVACQHSAGSNGSDDAPDRQSDPTTVFTPYTPDSANTNDNTDALAALKRIADADKPGVDELEGQWVPQLSSKEDGTFDPLENQTYDYAAILAEHLKLRLAYPDARLLFSSNWKSFLARGYWVTIVATPSGGPRPANDFCIHEGFPYSHCYAKRILRDGPADGSTKHRDQ